MEKLDRTRRHQINANQGDRFELWDSPIHSDRQNLTIKDKELNDVLAVYGITRDQLASLYLEIGTVLGKPPEPTVHHLTQIRDLIDNLIAAADPNRHETNDEGDFGWAK